MQKDCGLRLGILGSLPPPLNGISTQTWVLIKKLPRMGINVEYFDSAWIPGMSPNLEIVKENLSKIKTSDLHALLIQTQVYEEHCIVLREFKGKKILAIHGRGFIINAQNEEKRTFYKQFIDWFICENLLAKHELLKIGIEKEKISVINPFYDRPPINSLKPRKEIISFINKNNRTILWSGNIELFNNQDIYGFDQLIELISNSKCLSFLIVVGVKQSEAVSYFNLLKRKLHIISKTNDCLIIDNHDFDILHLFNEYPEKLVLLRTTVTDGNAHSLLEGMKYGIPVIASDLNNRPEGVITYKNLKELKDKLITIKPPDKTIIDKVKETGVESLKIFVNELKRRVFY